MRKTIRPAIFALSILSLGGIANADFLPVNSLYLTSSSTAPDVLGKSPQGSNSPSYDGAHQILTATGVASTYFPNGNGSPGTSTTIGSGVFSLTVHFNSNGSVNTTTAVNSLDIYDSSSNIHYFESTDLTNLGYHFTTTTGIHPKTSGGLDFTFADNTGTVAHGGSVDVFMTLTNVSVSSPGFGSTSWQDTPPSMGDPINAYAAAPLPSPVLGGLALLSFVGVAGLGRRRRQQNLLA